MSSTAAFHLIKDAQPLGTTLVYKEVIMSKTVAMGSRDDWGVVRHLWVRIIGQREPSKWIILQEMVSSPVHNMNTSTTGVISRHHHHGVIWRFRKLLRWASESTLALWSALTVSCYHLPRPKVPEYWLLQVSLTSAEDGVRGPSDAGPICVTRRIYLAQAEAIWLLLATTNYTFLGR
jgi:hypothetical protein